MSLTPEDQLMRLADEYAHCYAFVGDDSMPIKRAEIQAYAESKQSELDKANSRIAQLEDAVKFALSELEGIWVEDAEEWVGYIAGKTKLIHVMEIPSGTWMEEHDKVVEVKILAEVVQDLQAGIGEDASCYDAYDNGKYSAVLNLRNKIESIAASVLCGDVKS